MEQKKHNIQISESLYRDIKLYCDANKLKMSGYIETLLRKNFTSDCYGEIPSIFINTKPSEEIKQEPLEQPSNTVNKVIDSQIIKKETKIEENHKEKEDKIETENLLFKRKITKLK